MTRSHALLVVAKRLASIAATQSYRCLRRQYCIALANNMHLRGRSKYIALRVCFIQKLIQDGLINVKQCPTAAQIANIGTKALLRVPFETFPDQVLGDKYVGEK